METQELISNVNQKPVQLSGFFELLRESFKIVKERFWIYLGIILIPIIGISIIIVLLAIGASLLTALSAVSWFKWAFLIILLMLGAIVVIWPTLAILYVAKERDRSVGIFEALKRTFPKILPAYWISLLVNSAVFAGFFFFVIPGFIFWVWFSLATPVLLSENVRGVKALSRSKELVKGKAWEVFVRLMGLTIIGGSISFITEPLLKSDMTIKNLIAYLMLIPTALILNVFVFLLYEKLRDIRKEDYKEERTEGETYQGA